MDNIAYMLFGGSGDYHKFQGGMGALHRYGIDGTLPGVARWAIPILKERGIKRFWCHNIGGMWYFFAWDQTKTAEENKAQAMKDWGIPWVDTRGMLPNEWEIAQMLGAPWATQEQLEEFHYLLRDAGIEEIIYYLGDPVIVSTNELRRAYLKPFIHLKGASFGFDHVFTAEDFAECKNLFKWIRKHKVGIYTEARPHVDVNHKKYSRYISGTIATEHRDDAKPEMLANAIEHWGETIVLEGPDRAEGFVSETMTLLERYWYR